MNFGQGEFGFTFCPIAKSKPEPEYSTVFIEPIALDASSMTDLASCANAIHDTRAINVATAISLLNIFASKKNLCRTKRERNTRSTKGARGTSKNSCAFCAFCVPSPYHKLGQ